MERISPDEFAPRDSPTIPGIGGATPLEAAETALEQLKPGD